ncbi:hypothetical protein [Gaoshiqia sediminis]|uniref:Uncharacterized protein n=1 Tax=Gaoshiqia sediminis TaxID=2986998 RepID=A0AA41Y5H4_9BACT|nr:hypothetical protein [Gaoshiqia sediminis]MCW0481886.1 hypothetical protein [Gaoshiqia sediminis]
MSIDEVGNGAIKVSMSMNANQWQVWLQSLGNNPALLKRTMEKELPAYFLDNFKLEKNDMDRSFEFSFKAYGICQVNKRGKWIVNTDQKNPDITKLTDNKYMMVWMEPRNNIQQTQIIDFPPTARNIEINKDAFGKTQFEFDINTPKGSFHALFWPGLILSITGIVWLFILLFIFK